MIYHLSSDFSVQILEELPPDVTWKEIVSLRQGAIWKQNCNLTISTSSSRTGPFLEDMKPSRYYNLQLLQSNLQKAVRRRNFEVAVRTSQQMITQDVSKFLRRFPIIVLEDAVLHPRFPALVFWMMAATKGYRFTLAELEAMLGLVLEVAQSQHRDRLAKAAPPYLDLLSLCQSSSTSLIIINLPAQARAQLLAIGIRASYGGMPGDVAMMMDLAQRWARRFETGLAAWTAKLADVYPGAGQANHPASLLIEFNETHYLLAAVDFHVYRNQFFTAIHTLAPSLTWTDAQIQDACWFHRSSTVLGRRFVCALLQPLLPAEDRTPDDPEPGLAEKKRASFDCWISISYAVGTSSFVLTGSEEFARAMWSKAPSSSAFEENKQQQRANKKREGQPSAPAPNKEAKPAKPPKKPLPSITKFLQPSPGPASALKPPADPVPVVVVILSSQDEMASVALAATPAPAPAPAPAPVQVPIPSRQKGPMDWFVVPAQKEKKRVDTSAEQQSPKRIQIGD